MLFQQLYPLHVQFWYSHTTIACHAVQGNHALSLNAGVYSMYVQQCSYLADIDITIDTTSNHSSTCIVLVLVASHWDSASPQGQRKWLLSQHKWLLTQQLFSQRFYSS